MQLSARETSSKPLPVDPLPANVSPSAFAFIRRHGALANCRPAKSSSSPIKPARAASNNARAPQIAVLNAAPGRIRLNAQP